MLALNEAVQRIGHADTAMLVIRLLRAEKASLDVSDATWHPTDDLMYATTKSPRNAPPAPRMIMIHGTFYTISLRDIGCKPARREDYEFGQNLEPPMSPWSSPATAPFKVPTLPITTATSPPFSLPYLLETCRPHIPHVSPSPQLLIRFQTCSEKTR